MGAGRRLFAWAPAWMWLFWLAGALVILAGLRRGGEPEPRFLVATGSSIELWHGPDRERTLLRYDDGSLVSDLAVSEDGRMIAFLRLLLVTAAVASLPRNLRAQGCDCLNDSNCSCPPDYPSCFFNPSTGEAICCGPSNVGCSGPSLTWCCPPGSQCYGTDGQCLSNQ